MKKIINIFILFILFMGGVEAKSKFYINGKFSDTYIHIKSGKEAYNGNMYKYVREDGKLVYCIEPFKLIKPNVYYEEYEYNSDLFNISEEVLNKINLISYYGYGFYNHDSIEWYIATQVLIWKSLGVEEIFFTDSSNNKVNKYEAEINEINSLVDKHLEKPSFSGSHFEYSSNRQYEIYDTNDVLSNYEIKESNIESKIINNKLIIDTKEDGIYNITFIKKSPIDTNYKLYYLSGAQALISPGKLNDITFNITIEVNSGNIIINKFDSESEERIEATLKGAIYGIYNDSGLIAEITTDESGVATFNDLELGNYYVKELKPSEGYELDTNIYYINLTKENKSALINSYEKIIKAEVILNKYYVDSDNYTKEDDAIFELYNSNLELVETFKTENGSAKKTIPFGEYYLVQIKGKDGYSFIDKFKISINEKRKYVFELYDKREVLVVDVPDTLKNDYKSKVSASLIITGLFLVFISKKRAIL